MNESQTAPFVLELDIKNLERLLRVLDRLTVVEVLQAPTEKATILLYGETQLYPPPSRKKMIWKSDKQRRFVLWAIKTGAIVVPYVRKSSGGLGGSWIHYTKTTPTTVEGVVASNSNKAPYNIYVMGEGTQSLYHAKNWRTDKQIAESKKGEIESIYERHIDSIIG